MIVGGRSGEHEISLISGKHILQALDRSQFEPVVVIIQKNGDLTLGSESDLSALPNNPKQVKTPAGKSISIQDLKADVAFPVLHGPGGEDGTIQGMFELLQIPVVGCGVKASAICMDKAMTKRLCMQAGLPVAPFIELYRGDSIPKLPWEYPVFVKPATLGSSLGVSKVKSASDLMKACEEAFRLDEKILIEKGIVGREIEIAVFGKRGDLTASPAGEIKMRKAEFYSYDAKYVDEDAAELILPTTLPSGELGPLQQLAKNIFLTLDCRGMARIDFFRADDTGQMLLNEVNTIPGFTPISMYPKLMGLAGIGYSELITRLIGLAH